MKIRNFLFATMIACGFVACSSDNDPIDGPVNNSDTTLKIKYESVQTKAVTDDSAINTLTVIIGNQNGKIEKIETGPNKGTTEVIDIEVVEGNKQVIVVANAAITAKVADDFADLAKEVATFKSEDPNLSMNSKVYNITITPGKHHYLGYGTAETTATEVYFDAGEGKAVKLYRNVAKIILDDIKLGTKLTEENSNYPNAKFTLKEVLIVQSHNTTNLFGAAFKEWGTTHNVTDWVMPWASDKVPASEDPKYNKADWGASYSGYIQSTSDVIDAEELVKIAIDPFYVYENTDIDLKEGLQTIMAVMGDIEYDTLNDDGNGVIRAKIENRYYPFAVGVSGTVTPDITNFLSLESGRDVTKPIGVLRNLQYNISLGLNGIGYPDPWGGVDDDTLLDVKVEVVAWGKVKQDVTID